MKKKNILMVLLSLCLIAVIAVSGTLAYFTDSTQAQQNVFTLGKVNIDLYEQDETDGTPITSGGIDYSGVVPGDSLVKIVTVTKTDDSQDCYVAIKVTAGIPDAYATVTGRELHEILQLVLDEVDGDVWSPIFLNAAGQAVTQTEAEKVPVGTVAILFGRTGALSDSEDEATLFSEVTIPTEWGNEIGDGQFTLSVEAYAVQAANMETQLATGSAVAQWVLDNQAQFTTTTT